jgi:hypothetical protein
MSLLTRKSAIIAASVAAMMTSVSTAALAQAPNAPRTILDGEAIFIDGKALTVAPGRAKDDIGSQLGNMNVHPLGPGAIVFRAGDKLYVIDGAPMGATFAMVDPEIDRQRSYGGLNDDRQRSYGGLYDYPQYGTADRQRSYGGLNDDRQRSYGGLYDYPQYGTADRQRSYGGLYDYPQYGTADRQRSYGGLYDYPQYGTADRQRSYGGLNDDRQRSYGGFYDSAAESRRQQSYGGLYDPNYANYRLKKVFGAVWGATEKN